MATMAPPHDVIDLPRMKDGDLARVQTAILRVVAGRLAGRQHPLKQGARLCIGHALANDIVLRGAGTRGTVLELRCDGETATLRVIAGCAELLGRSLSEGEEAHLPPYLPFRLGEFVLAYGDAGSDRWAEAEKIAATPAAAPLSPLPAPSLADRMVRLGRERVEAAHARIDAPRVALIGASILCLCGGAWFVQNSLAVYQSRPANFEQRLAEQNLPGLEVEANPAGGLIVRGVVANDAQLMKLRSMAGSATVPVVVDVTSAGAMAAAASEILQAQGIDAAVESNRRNPHGIIVNAPFMAADRRETLREMLERDLPGLKQIVFRIDDTRGANALQSFFAASGTGMATLVADPGYIVTADGARWFPGAVLPTGHRLISIEENRIRFEKDGRVEDLRL